MKTERNQKRTPQQVRRRRKPESSKRPVSKATAAAARSTLRGMPSLAPVRGAPARAYPLSQALLHLLDADAPPVNADGRAWTRFSSLISVVMTLNGFFGAMTIGDLGADASRGYDNHRLAAGGRPGKPLKPSGRDAEKTVLRKAVRLFIEHHGLVGSFELPNTTKVEPFAKFRLKREHLSRLLWAARGRTWDAGLGAWVPCPPWDPERPGAIATDPAWKARLCLKRDRAHVARAIIVAAYTASKAMCVTRLRWREGPDDRSHLSLDGMPMLHRLGGDAATGKLAGEPVLLNRRVLAHLRRWHASDEAAGFVRVVHHRGSNRELVYAPTQSFRHIVQDAGLPGNVRFDDLRLSAGAVIAKKEGMVLRSGALLLGVATSSFLKSYGHLAADYQQTVMDAFGRKPGKEKTCKATEAAGSPRAGRAGPEKKRSGRRRPRHA